MSSKLNPMPDKCIYCQRAGREKMYVINFPEGTALFHMTCFKIANPDLEEDVQVFLKYKLDKKEDS